MAKLAVVGAGISGLVAAHLLSERHEVFLFEGQDRMGGHTHTVEVSAPDGRWPVDTGFIVHNDWTYPNFIALMKRLGVATQPSQMSFSVRCDRTGTEYNGTSLNSLFAQRRNLLSPAFLRMVADILRFNREAVRDLETADMNETLGDYLRKGGYSQRFRDHYILPMAAAVWSTGTGPVEGFPFLTFARFFKNHGMLSVDERPTWRVLKGGSQAYLEPFLRPLAGRVRQGDPVVSVRRSERDVKLRLRSGHEEAFDEVILAAHSDESLALLEDPSPAEREILGALPYESNETLLHTDTRVLPKRRLAWAAWNYRIGLDREGTEAARGASAAVTYNMNILQSLASRETYLVSLNLAHAIDPAKVLKRIHYRHPVYTVAAGAARSRRAEICGQRRTHYCGAYWAYGFHEDGVNSALAVCERFGARL
jgi:predicted NAD/FAD-binding protein